MKTRDIGSILKAARIPDGDYSIGEPIENTFVLCKEHGVWKTFMFERGLRDLEEEYASEDDACRNFVSKLILARRGHD